MLNKANFIHFFFFLMVKGETNYFLTVNLLEVVVRTLGVMGYSL